MEKQAPTELQNNKLSPLLVKDQPSGNVINGSANQSPVSASAVKFNQQQQQQQQQLPPFSSLPPLFYYPPTAIQPGSVVPPPFMHVPPQSGHPNQHLHQQPIGNAGNLMPRHVPIQSLQPIAPMQPLMPQQQLQLQMAGHQQLGIHQVQGQARTVSVQQKRGRGSPTKAPITQLTDKQLVWAKLGIKSPHWPAQLILHPDSLACTKLMPKPRDDYLLVHLFGNHEYHYVSPNNISAFSALDTEKLKKSRSHSFQLGVKEVLAVIAGNGFPADWDLDDTRFVQSALDKLKMTRPEAVHHAEESSRLLGMGLIVDHRPGFRPLQRPGNDVKARRRRNYRITVMQRLALCAPNPEYL